MSERTTTEVQRTLIITCGLLAQTAGEMFTTLLNERSGPSVATAIVPLTAAEPDDNFITAVTDALTDISPPDLAARLSQSGWALAQAAEITLFVLMDTMLPDTTSDVGKTAVDLLTLTTDLIYRHLGVESRSLHIWLAGQNVEADAANSLNERIPATRGIIALSLRNSAGLRLPDEAALAAHCAELLWALIATPLRLLPESAAEHNSHTYNGNPPLLTLGIAGWDWSPEAVHAAFVRHWLDDVLAAWLASPEDPVSPEEVAIWLAEKNLDAHALTNHALEEKDRQPPNFSPDMWRAPWPWHIPRLWQSLKTTAETDCKQQADRVQKACLQMAEQIIRITAVWRQESINRLDRQPDAGISRVCAWLEAALSEYNRLYEQTWDDEAVQEETDSLLAAEQEQLEAAMRHWLESFPQPTWQAWGAAILRPWHWPRLAWLYSRWQRFGPQLNRILYQQAVRRRQKAINTAVRQALNDLEKNLRRLQSQVEEIGEMLAYLTAEADAAFPAPASHPEAHAETALNLNSQSPIVHLNAHGEVSNLRIPSSLYHHLIPNDAVESVTAAAAIGGLGQQVDRLDDTILEALTRLGRQRLEEVWQLTAVDIFTTVAKDDDQRQQWWRALWQMARPLWRIDETQLGEAERASHNRISSVSGASVPLLPDLLPNASESIQWLPSKDQERILLIRARSM